LLLCHHSWPMVIKAEDRFSCQSSTTFLSLPCADYNVAGPPRLVFKSYARKDTSVRLIIYAVNLSRAENLEKVSTLSLAVKLLHLFQGEPSL
jgi:hypothetical protein